VLVWDALRQRENQYEVQRMRTAPNVLSFRYDIVMDGRMDGTAVRCFQLFRLDPVEPCPASQPERLRTRPARISHPYVEPAPTFLQIVPAAAAGIGYQAKHPLGDQDGK
jgi:hypothetical protein